MSINEIRQMGALQRDVELAKYNAMIMQQAASTPVSGGQLALPMPITERLKLFDGQLQSMAKGLENLYRRVDDLAAKVG